MSSGRPAFSARARAVSTNVLAIFSGASPAAAEEDCIDCKTEADAWRLKHIYDQTRAALTKACERIADGHQTYEEAATAEMWADRFLSEANIRRSDTP